ncbi:hypothetical protein ABZY06_34855 [Streptomyces sp. NPDC006540]|jgi:hypothetical protein|uniref:hypothetical protein n=1 Tax=Streptomyces sp. NPDC006540 TaxID=3155353 RepID=UPI0033A56183
MGHTAFPDDLVQAQRDFDRAYAALAVPRPRAYTPLRRRLLRLSAELMWHPFWGRSTAPSPTGWAELRGQVHALEREEGR